MHKYPELTPYQFASNRPIDGFDRDGLEYCPYIPKFNTDGRSVNDYLGAIDNGVIDILNLAPSLWNSGVATVQSIKRKTYGDDLRQDANQTYSSLKQVGIKIWNKPLETLTSPDAVEFLTSVYLSGKIATIGGNKGNLLAPVKAAPASVEDEQITSAFKGGAKKDLLSKQNIIEGNHLPTLDGFMQAGFKISKGKGSAIQMLYEEHRLFISTGISAEAMAFRKAEAALLKIGKFTEAFDLNANRVLSTYGNKYNSAIQEAREYFQKEIVPELNKQLKK